MGYAAACLNPGLKRALGDKRVAAGFMEAVAIVLAGVAVVLFNDVLLRAVFTLIAAAVVLLLSLELGPVSKLLGVPPFVRLGRYELDFYVFHQPCIWLASYLIGGHGRKALFGFVLTVGFVLLWRAFNARCLGCHRGASRNRER